MIWRTLCVIIVLAISVWSATEITSPVYHVRFTAKVSHITLSPFPYDVSGVSVSVPTSEDTCLWVVNKSLEYHYLYNATNILLQPFGVNFTNVHVECFLLEAGWTGYYLYIGDTCPCKNVECKRVTWYWGSTVTMHAGQYNKISLCNVFGLCNKY